MRIPQFADFGRSTATYQDSTSITSDQTSGDRDGDGGGKAPSLSCLYGFGSLIKPADPSMECQVNSSGLTQWSPAPPGLVMVTVMAMFGNPPTIVLEHSCYNVSLNSVYARKTAWIYIYLGSHLYFHCVFPSIPPYILSRRHLSLVGITRHHAIRPSHKNDECSGVGP